MRDHEWPSFPVAAECPGCKVIQDLDPIELGVTLAGEWRPVTTLFAEGMGLKPRVFNSADIVRRPKIVLESV